ncbi:MAG TPA: hypothetical protein VEF91_02535, partial [Verrucomicrobiae bacterium]|nr:hypothetical protein [Verrucomicrobiae bacterium]
VILGSVAFQFLPIYTLLTLLSLPFVYRSIMILRRHYDDPRQMAPANLGMIKAHSVTAFGLISGYVIQGLLNKANTFQLLFILVLFTIVYAPVAWMLLNVKKRN